MDLVKAVLIGTVLISGFFMLPVIIAVLSMFAGFVILVGTIWFIIKIVKEDPKPPP